MPELCYPRAMNLAKLGKKGQVSIPKAVLEQLGLEGGQLLLVEPTDDGAIVLRPAGVYPIEIYSDERIQEFLEENEITPEEEAKIEAKLASLKR
jgi:AbrB family looped-hinge helix DNA binding protein